MLKIHKGLKKKKKDKKNKRKEDELFDEEELEKYRKEHSHAVPAADSSVAQPSNSEQSDEWQKFKALTAGVDTILQKTQEDLDRIKSTSFFQRKAPPSEVEKQKEEEAEEERNARLRKEDGDGGDEYAAVPSSNRQPPLPQQDPQQQQQPPKSDSEDESEEVEVDDTLFDTSYVDAVASGELKLAYIPDSPPEPQDDFDPFDTSYANKYIESNPKKRYLNLGCAVQVLSGRQTTVAVGGAVDKKSPRRRPKPVDLLLTSFDEGVDANAAAAASTVAAVVVERTPLDSPVKTLLDEDPLFVKADEIPPLSVTPIPAPLTTTPVNPTAATAADKKNDKLDLSDFDVLASTSVSAGVGGSGLLDELHKRASSESTDDEFAQLAAESLARKSSSALPTPNGGSGEALKSFDALTPTDNCITGAAFPLQPAAPPAQEEIDPFDTSIVAKVILPGKQEIKLLEKELLSDIAAPVAVPTSVGGRIDDIDDDDFDPRAGESSPAKAIRPQELLIERKAEAEKIVSPSKKPDFLKIEEIDAEVAKPLTPLAANNQELSLQDADDYDPFDTSHVCGAPGKLELKLIESELTKQDDVHADDDDDFDPRKYDSVAESRNEPTSITHSILNKYSCNPQNQQQQQQQQEPAAIDILTGNEQVSVAVHVITTPVQPEKYVVDSPEIAYSDPFDTSIADNIQPGKVELKLLETELIN